MFDKYQYFKQSKSEMKQEEIVHNISNKLLDQHGYNTVFYLGALLQLKCIASVLEDEESFNKQDVLEAIDDDYKKQKEMPDDIKELADIILKEFDYKENANAPNI